MISKGEVIIRLIKVILLLKGRSKLLLLWSYKIKGQNDIDQGLIKGMNIIIFI